MTARIMTRAFSGGLLLSLALVGTAYAASGSGGGGGGGSTTTTVVTLTTPTITSFAASPTSIFAGGSSELSWTATGVKTCTLTQAGVPGTITSSGATNTGIISSSKTVTPKVQSTYMLLCVNNAGLAVARFATVSILPSPSCTLTANKTSYLTGESMIFSWIGTQGLDSARWSQPVPGTNSLTFPTGVFPAEGTQTILANVVGVHTATLLMFGSNNTGGNAQCSRTITVADPISSGTIFDALSITPLATLSGVAKYTPTVEVLVLDASGTEIYAASGIPVASNTMWSHDIAIPLEVGVYTTKLYDDHHKFLDDGILTIDPDAPEVLRVVSEYEGNPANHGFCYHEEGASLITVVPNSHAQVIALTAYEPVKWTVDIKRGSNVKRIIVSGYYPARVTITGAPEYANVPIDYTTRYDYGTLADTADGAAPTASEFVDSTDASLSPTILSASSCATATTLLSVAPENQTFLRLAGSSLYSPIGSYFYGAPYEIAAPFNPTVQILKSMTGLDIYTWYYDYHSAGRFI